jgi:ribonuclease HI
MSKIIVYTDGGARGNPGPAGAGVVIQEEGGKVLAEVKQFVGEHQTNNWAEYEAVLIAFGKLFELLLRDRDIEFRLDSLLVVEQLMGNWKIKEAGLKIQAEKIRDLMKDFSKVTFVHIPREQNSEADRLVNEAIDEH